MFHNYSITYITLIALLLVVNLSACSTKKTPVSINNDSDSLWTDICKDWDDWDKPGPAFRLFGNSYFVGTCGISAILITGDEGHILIDSGTEAGADVVVRNIKALGFSIEDVQLLLHSHEHFDHVGGIATLQKISGARLLASMAASPVLSTGISADDDPQAGISEPFDAARVDGIIHDGQTITLGNLMLTPIATPGHTPGALSWQWQSCDNDHCLTIVYADSLSPISRDDYLFSDHPQYLHAYKQGLNKLTKLECDVVLAPHPSASQMRTRLLSPQGLVNNNGCKNYADAVLDKLNIRLIKEQ